LKRTADSSQWHWVRDSLPEEENGSGLPLAAKLSSFASPPAATSIHKEQFMAAAARILAFAGSLRKGSYNKKLVAIAEQGAQEAGAQVTHIDLRDFPLPLYDGDLEEAQGIPEIALRLKALFKEHDGFLISAPEYNSSITAVLKNAIDWVSRQSPNEPPLAGFKGKTAALMSASPGGLGGLRGLVHVRAILGNIGVIVLPDQIAVARAHEAFHEDGSLKDGKQQQGIKDLGKTLAEFLKKCKA
jgi:NAD(P)H-dependent FMN reductase